MKNRIFLLILLCVGLLLLVSACSADSLCTHNVGNNSWQTIQKATCVSTGIEEGICSLCYKTVTRTIKINPNAHCYEEWDVQQPTHQASGIAGSTCTLCSTPYSTTLPQLDDEADQINYKSSSITTRPTATTQGVRTYVFEDTAGDIQFDVAISSTGIASLRDAVEVASMSQSKELIRSAQGSMGYEYYVGSSASGKYGLNAFSYEFGDNYTHIVDGIDNCERWYFTDTTVDANGNEIVEYYGLTNYGGSLYDEILAASGSKHYIDGNRLYFQYGPGLGYFYGAESLLDGLYRAARSSTNNDYVEEIDTQNNTYKFSFGALQLSGDTSQYFSIITVEFSFSDALTIDTLSAICTTYINNTHSGIKTWEIDDETGYAYVIAGQEQGDRYISEIHIAQTLKTDNDQVPQNPYSCENMFITSFDIYDSTEGVYLEQGVAALITANSSTLSRFQIVNITPQTAQDMILDSLSCYYRTIDANGNVVDTPIDYASLSSVGVSAYFSNSAKTLSIRTSISGTVTVVIKTEKYFEYELVVYSDEKIPTKLYPSLLVYSSSGYMAQEYTSTAVSSAVEVAIGQPLYFKARVDTNYESAQFSASLTGVDESGTAYTTSQLELITDITQGHLATDITNGAIVDGYQYCCFEANSKGTYTIKLTSDLSSSKTATFKVTVVDAPSVEDMCASSYTQELNYPTAGTVSVSFALASQEDIPTDDEGNVDESKDYYIATIQFNGMIEYLLCEWATPAYINNDGTSYVNARKYLITSHLRGVEQNFSIEWNEGYDLVLAHPTGFGSLIESVTLTKTVTE